MNLPELADLIETMIVEHKYPGFEARALHLGLPESALKSPARIFGQGLMHGNVFVQLASLRWFQSHPGMAKSYADEVLVLADSADEWVRYEAIRTLVLSHASDNAVILKISSLLKDPSEMVKVEAAKACGKLLSKLEHKNASVIALLREAASDPNEKVRWKAQKALRRLGAYSVLA